MKDRSADFQAVIKSMSLLGVDVSWLPEIIKVLHRDYPEVIEAALHKAVTDHLTDRLTDPEHHPYTGDGTSSCVFCNSPMNAHLEGTGL
jgi:hypothetical protein